MSPMKVARTAGAVYLVFSIIAVIGEFAFPGFWKPGDPAGTAGAIAGAESAYRWSVLTSFVTVVLHLVLMAILYELFIDVDRRHTVLMTLFVAVGVAAALSNLMVSFVPLVIVDNATVFSSFTQAQRDVLTLGALEWRRAGAAVPMSFWGFWLFPFGTLVIRSRMFPRILGVLLMIAGVGYLVTGFSNIVFPEHRQLVGKWMMPLYFGEIPIVFWLLIKGARERRA
ncbi:MAG TPA: DUF4386 domain-containing protein [Candidatus Krumholzibacteria bacterium]